MAAKTGSAGEKARKAAKIPGVRKSQKALQAADAPASGAARAERALFAALQSTIEAICLRQQVTEREEFSLDPVNPVNVLVALSGGRDSMVLTDVLVRMLRKKQFSLIASVTAAHIHHGLSEHADEWVEKVEKACAGWGIPLVVEHVYVNKASGLGIEGAAREARYRALSKIARRLGTDVVLTAHHQDDRLETFLLQWMRGAGPDGLSAMSTIRNMESTPPGRSPVLARPFLDVPRSLIDEYAGRNVPEWVEDESNEQTRYLRNLIRNEVLPRLDAARPGWRQAAARSVSLVAQAGEVMKSVGQDDVALCRAETPRSLVIARLLSLPIARQALCLKSWLAEEGVRIPSKARLYEALRQVRETGSDTRLTIRMDGREIRRWGANIVLCDVPSHSREKPQDVLIEWKGEEAVSPRCWAGSLRFIPCKDGEPGFDADALRHGVLEVRARKGAEKIKLFALRPSRNLKHLYQQLDVPAFERPLLPLVWLNGRLIYAAGLGAEVRLLADPDFVADRVRLEWVPDKPLLP